MKAAPTRAHAASKPTSTAAIAYARWPTANAPSPTMNAASRRAEIALGKLGRIRNQPRA